MARLKLKDRWEMYEHALIHIMHGLFPNWAYFEKKVDSPDFDHVPLGRGFTGKDYLEHLKMNWRCSVRHRIMARYPYLEVRIK